MPRNGPSGSRTTTAHLTRTWSRSAGWSAVTSVPASRQGRPGWAAHRAREHVLLLRVRFSGLRTPGTSPATRVPGGVVRALEHGGARHQGEVGVGLEVVQLLVVDDRGVPQAGAALQVGVLLLQGHRSRPAVGQAEPADPLETPGPHVGPAQVADLALGHEHRLDRPIAPSGIGEHPPGDLARMLDAVRGAWGLAPEAEVTTEANPDSVTPDSLAALAGAGFTRVSFGMQSAVPHVLATLERTHDPSRVPEVVRWARDAGLDTSLDLIYGTPGESLDDWRRSVEVALDCGVDHVSAYALVIEPGTRMAAAVRRGVLPGTDPDDQATRYELADEMLAAAGLPWYEVSNWA